MKELKVIDLFSGAGGMSVGFEWLSSFPFLTVWANDYNHYAVNTYNKNFDNVCIYGDIVEILESKVIDIPTADIVIGGPPCQGFSLLNKKRDNDPRKKLWIPYMQIVKECNAEIFVMENVPQVIGSIEHQEILDFARDNGFITWSGILLAADYGVPQTRKRAIIVGSKNTDPSSLFPPIKTHFNPEKTPKQIAFQGSFSKDARPWKTVKDAISDLPSPEGTEIRGTIPPLNLHFGRNPTEKSIMRYKAIPEEGMNRFDLQRNAPELTPDCWIRKKSGGTDLFGRLWWNRPAFTIRTEFFKPEKGRYLHPEQHRPITHREAARFQTFPDNFVFTGTKLEIARQIGNAVPPLLGKAIADQVYKLWLSSKGITEDGYFYETEETRDYVSCSKQEYTSRTVS